MADNRTMAQLLQAPTVGYEDAIVIPEIAATNFELKHCLINLVQNKQFFGHDKEDPHAHIRYFNKITSTMRVPNVPNSTIKLMLFPFSLEGAAWIWLKKEPPRSILTWDDLVSKFINQFFPPSKTTNLHNEITRFQQRFDGSFSEAWDRFNDLLRACPHHGFSFYNALNVNDQDSLNSTEGGNFLDKMPSDCLKIIESKSKVRQSRAKAVVAKVNSISSTPAISSDVAELKDMVRALILDKKNSPQLQLHLLLLLQLKQLSLIVLPAVVLTRTKTVPLPVETFIKTTSKSMYHKPQQPITTKETLVSDLRWLQIKSDLPNSFPFKIIKTISIRGIIIIKTEVEYSKPGSKYAKPVSKYTNQYQTVQNQLANLMDMMSKFMSSNMASSSGSGTLPVVKQGTEVTKDQVQTPSSQSTTPVQPSVSQSETPVFEPVVAPVSASMPNLKSSIPYPLRRDNERRREQANEQIEKFYEIFKDMSFENSFTDALILMPKFASTLKALIVNKEKLSEMAKTLMNEHCSAVILNKLPKKLGDPNKFLIPCEFPGMDECLALADLGASINLMPLSMWKELSLLKLTPTCMTLELVDHSVSKPIGIAKDVLVKVAITYNLDQTSRYSANYDQMTVNKIDVTDKACEEYSQEVLGFFDVTTSGSPTPSDDPILSTTSPTLTPFGDSDFLLFEEADAFLGLEDDLDSPEFNPSYYDLEGDILMLEAILNSDPTPSLPNHEQYVPSFKNELKACEAKMIKSSVNEPPEVELKDLPPHIEYAFLEGDNNPWVSPVHCVPKKGGFTVVKNEENELIPTRLVTGWRGTNTIVSSMVSPGIFKFPSTLVIRKKQRLPALMGRSPTVACLLVCAMRREHFKGEFFQKLPLSVRQNAAKISKNRIEVDKAKVDVITKLPHPTTVK
nr:reverse transcriptase domain-containing protein [Tanacetum cinerariifolium]